MGDLRTVLLEGIFYEEDENILVQTDQHPAPVQVHEALKPMLEREIHLVAHHYPLEPLDKNRWGGGCCMWESSGTCPAGHHKDPSSLFNIGAEGILHLDPIKGWFVDGTPIDFKMLAGHRSRVVAVSKFDLSSLRGSLTSLDPEDLGKLGDQATEMRARLTQLQGFLRGMKGD